MKILILIICVISCIESLKINSISYGYIGKWYAEYVAFSDWRKIQHCDYATNVPVYMWYTKENVKSYRPNDIGKFLKDLALSDTIRVGIDYYALNICYKIIPKNITSMYGTYLANGGVLICKVYKYGLNKEQIWIVDR